MNMHVILQVDVLTVFHTTTYNASFIVCTVSYEVTSWVCCYLYCIKKSDKRNYWGQE
jgi:hypothetical protein